MKLRTKIKLVSGIAVILIMGITFLFISGTVENEWTEQKLDLLKSKIDTTCRVCYTVDAQGEDLVRLKLRASDDRYVNVEGEDVKIHCAEYFDSPIPELFTCRGENGSLDKCIEVVKEEVYYDVGYCGD